MTADEILHGFVRVVLRYCSPRRAYAIVTELGALLPQHRDRTHVLRAGARIRRTGTCLSRALTLAARAPSAELVIAVAPRAGQKLFAHAWLEFAGVPIDPSEVAGSEIARIRRDLPRTWGASGS